MNPLLAVSDHAVLRWIERVHGIDIELIRQRIRSDLAKATVVSGKIGAPKYVVRLGPNRFVVKDGTVVTVLDAGMVGRSG